MAPPLTYRWWTFDAGIQRVSTDRLRGVFVWAKLGPLAVCAYPPAQARWAGIVVELNLLNSAFLGITLGA